MWLYSVMRNRTIDGLGDKIRGYVKDWQIKLGLSGWDLEISFNLAECIADCRVIGPPEYETGRLRFNTRKIRKEKLTDAELEAAVIHEVLHILLWEIVGEHANDEQERNEERVVQRITRALLKY